MKKCRLPIRIVSLILIGVMSVMLTACNRDPVEFVDPDEGKMPEFKYIIFPLLAQAQDLYDRIFSSVEYGNKSVAVGDIAYYFVEPSQYETESFESLINGTFTKQYADEYIELMYGGDEPLYINQDGALYVNPKKLIEFAPVVYNIDFCAVSNYMGSFATVTVKLEDGTSLSYDVENIDGTWCLDSELVK